MNKRQCTYCNTEIPLDRPRSKYCSVNCGSKYNYRSSNRRSMFRMEQKRERRRYWLNKYKTSKGCEWCGYKGYPEALHLDHLDQSEKYKEVSSMFGYNLKRFMEEVRKCRVMCANCHSHHSKIQQKKGYFDVSTGLRTCE